MQTNPAVEQNLTADVDAAQ